MKHTLNRTWLLLGSLALALPACESVPKSVVASTGTSIGVEVSQNQASQAPQMKLGYNRAEVAVVSETEYSGDVANVLMELNYGGSNSTHPGIYQRLAVGRTAVRQAGAAAMFLKAPDGQIPSDEALRGVREAVEEFSEDNF